MICRGVRGATTVDRNDREEILTATRQLLALVIHRNGIEKQDVASAFQILPVGVLKAAVGVPAINSSISANCENNQQAYDHPLYRKASTD